MGFFTTKKKARSEDEVYTPPAPSYSNASQLGLASPNPSLSAPRSPKLSNASSSSPSMRFPNPFRSSSASFASPKPPAHSPQDARRGGGGPTPLYDQQHRMTSSPSHQNLLSHGRQLSVDTQVRYGAGPSSASSNHVHPTRRDNNSSWDDLGVPLQTASPQAYTPTGHDEQGSPVASLDRFRLFGAGGGRAGSSSSTVSLPLPRANAAATRRESMEELADDTPQHQHVTTTVSHAEKKSRWKLGRRNGGGTAAKRRSGSVGSLLSLNSAMGVGSNGGASKDGLGIDGAEGEGGFFVRSFRTISRVQDPISTGPYESLPIGSSPPLPALPLPSPESTLIPLPSVDASDSYASSSRRQQQHQPQHRPPLNVRNPGSGSWRDLQRAPSPSTVSVEAFRFQASSRSKSVVSLTSTLDDYTATREERPKFEPKTRRGSSNSQSEILAPPRPQFYSHSRNASSTSSNGGFHHQQEQGLVSSVSIASVASYATAPEGVVDYAPSSPSSYPLTSSSSSPNKPAPVRPATLSRHKSDAEWDHELKLIAMYGGGSPGSSPVETFSGPFPSVSPRASSTSPYIAALPFESSYQPPSTSSYTGVEHLRSASSPATSSNPSTPTAATRVAKLSASNPGFAIQPPTPTPPPSFGNGQHTSRGSPTPRRTSTASAVPVSPSTARGKGKGKTNAWASDSDEDEQDDDSDEDDEVPLATIRSRSVTDLSSLLLDPHSSSQGRQPTTTSSSNSSSVEMNRQGSSELEVLAEGLEAARLERERTKASQEEEVRRSAAEMQSRMGRGTPPVRRVGSQRRSVSTLSFLIPTGATTTTAIAPGSKIGTSSSPVIPTLRSTSNPSSPSIASIYMSSSTASSALATPAVSVSATPTTAPTSIASSPTSASTSQLVGPTPHFSPASSSGSGSSSGSSAPRTPKDSPAVSEVGVKTTSTPLRPPSTSFRGLGQNGTSLRSNALPPPSRSASSMGFASISWAPSTNAGSRASVTYGQSQQQQRQRSAVASSTSQQNHKPPSSSRSSAPLLSQPPPTAAAAPAAQSGDVFNRMKARHKAETLSAIAIGKDLNGPGPIRDDDDEDDDAPLSSLPTRNGGGGGSTYAGSAMSGFEGQGGAAGGGGWFAPQSSYGGYSPLATAPPGVDPYLYMSLPNDQKMQLHQRSQQMMQMMAQAALQAKAESTAGWETGSNVSGASAGGGSMRGSMSMGNFNAPYGSPGMMQQGFGSPMQMPMGYGYAPPSPQSAYGQLPSHPHLPVFAPSFAMSQPFLQPTMYAGSAVGVPGGGEGSVMGGSSPRMSAGGNSRRAPASTIGTSSRR